MKINTSCKECAFAKFEDKTQTGCGVQKLEVFQKRKEVKLIEDEELNYYNIDRLCPFFRNKNAEGWDNNNIEELKNKALSETRIRISLLLICKDNFSLEGLRKSLDSIKNQNFLPKKIYIGLASNRPKPSLVFNLLKEYSLLNHQIYLITEREDGKPLERNRIADILFNHIAKKECSHVLILDSGAELENNFLKNVNKSLTHDLERWLLINPVLDDNNHQKGPLVQYRIYKDCGGNEPATHERLSEDDKLIEIRCDTVQEKIYLLCKDDNSLELIKEYEDYLSD